MTSPTPLSAPHPLDEVFVLNGRRLRDGMRLEETSRFRDAHWRLDPACWQQHVRRWRLNFGLVPARYRLVAKELFYGMLSGELPPGEPRPDLASVLRVFSALSTFLKWLDTRAPRPGRLAGPALSELTGDDLLAYHRHLKDTVRNEGTRGNKRAAVRYLWRFRAALTVDRLPFDPAHLDGWSESRRSLYSENATDRIPEAVHGPLLTWALRFVDDFAEDILAADGEWWRLRDAARRSTAGTNTGAHEKIQAVLADYLARHRPLPGYRGAVNVRHLAAEAGCARRAVERYKTEVMAAVDVVGVSDFGYLDFAVTGRLDGEPWIERIASTLNSDRGLASLARMLHAAAAIVVLFLSGMRECEVKHLRRGCVQVQRDAHGRPYRWKVASLAFKGETEVEGVPATWVVGAPAARAIGVLERLQPADADLLFAVLPHNPRNSTATGRRNHAMTTSATNHQLNDFVQWVNQYCATHGRADGIPAVNGEPWRLSIRQFRRTLAWFIARRPGGAIAGAIHYRHHAVQVFEGYAGTSESGFRAEVESEQALARGEQLLAMVDQHEHKNLAGPAADEAARRLEDFGDRARFAGKVITDRRRLDRLMNRGDPAIYPGKYVTCIHTHATALCQQRRDSDGALRPDHGTCKPLACRNVALTADNIDNLRDEAARIDRELQARPVLPPLVTHQLRTRATEIETFLARHTRPDTEDT
ncbi:hypothetical protein BAY61_32310 (plasmid) [Prauserella marina]|uniref:Uncharacterized protein n=1 Tax=Prauserella marina TaxID=530584 RepID=A0A222W1A3_9PSEU|nr:hypothetical protein [Prauserella marina]ASR39967.1 hypothetical protein BAY61_32310 [Prauserella marina]PWV71304.1 hypothetical protein DES30_11220 [Prauserella marina]SDD96950.1 hypothetical protein SAMN05421630_11592 [Prauserella marina]